MQVGSCLLIVFIFLLTRKQGYQLRGDWGEGLNESQLEVEKSYKIVSQETGMMTRLENKCLRLAVRNLKWDQSPWLHFSPGTLAQQQNRQNYNVLFCQMFWFFHLGIVLCEIRICHHLLSHLLTDTFVLCPYFHYFKHCCNEHPCACPMGKFLVEGTQLVQGIYAESCLVSILLVIAKLLPKRLYQFTFQQQCTKTLIFLQLSEFLSA